jgi:hypothetical protein
MHPRNPVRETNSQITKTTIMKKSRQLHILSLVFLAAVILSSCYPGSGISDPYIVDEGRQKENVYYVPPASNTPLLTEKGDLSFDIMRASGSKFTGTELHAACVPLKHLGFMGSFSTGGNPNDEPDYLSYQRVEIGSGYVTKFSKGWHFENYAGLGNEKINNTHHTGYSKLNITNFFLQPTIAISNKNQTVQFAFNSRFSGINFKVRDTLFSSDREPFSGKQIKSLYDQPFHVMWEPALVFRTGWKNILFNAQYSFSSDLTNRDLYREKNNFSIGIILRCNTNTK